MRENLKEHRTYDSTYVSKLWLLKPVLFAINVNSVLYRFAKWLKEILNRNSWYADWYLHKS